MRNRAMGSEVVVPAALGEEQNNAFIDNLYDLHKRIFAGVAKETFAAYVVDSPAEWTRIRIYKNQRQEWIGYCAVHRFRVDLSGRRHVIFRAEAGILRAFRGRSMTLWFGFSEALKYRMRHPLESIYYLGTFVHPAVLYLFSRYIHKFYPQPGIPIPGKVKQLMLEMSGVFHFAPVEGQNELVRKVGWITIESNADRQFWRQHRNPAVRLYISTNPGYVNGNGLLTLMPLTFTNILMSLFRFAGNKLKRRIFGRSAG